MISYPIRKNYEEFYIYGTKVAVVIRPDGRINLKVHVPPGSHASHRKGERCDFHEDQPNADELRALAGV